MNKKSILTILIVIVLIIGAVAIYSLNSQPNEPASEKLVDSMMSNEMQEKAADTNMMELNGTNVEYTDGVTGYFALPEGAGPHPGLILIHEWWGLNDDIKSIADRFAQAGYAALAVDLYNGESTTDATRARELSSAVRDSVEPAFANLEDALDYLRSQPGVDSDKLASVGWCFGGGWAYQMASNDLDIDASVMYYGQFNPDDDFNMMKADILGHFGEEDAAIAIDSVREFQAALATANGQHEVYIYPNVGHGFANVRGGDNLAYSEAEAELAWQRTLDFLIQRFSQSDIMMEENSAMMEDSEIKSFDIIGKDFEFSLKEIRVQQGDTIRINFTSTDGFHDWVVDDYGATERVNTGESNSVEFVADTPGTYEFYCSVGRHREMGMVGTLIIE